MQFYLSEILGSSVLNQSREKIGSLRDVAVVDINKPHPVVRGIILKREMRKESVFIPAHDIAVASAKIIKLSTDLVDLTPFVQHDDEILLSKDMYDKQIVDIDDRRLTRVNDLLLEESHNVIRLLGVDVSSLGLLKRLNFPDILHILKRNVVDWEDVQFLGNNAPMKFNLQYKNLESLHPADIARIIFEGPGYKQGSKVLASLKDPIAADIIEELPPNLQKNLIESMKLEDVVDVLNHMSPDKATDTLVTLGHEFTQKILPKLDSEQAEVVLSLLRYPENSTGAYMNPYYIAVPRGITIDQFYTRVRDMDELPDFAYYIYVLESEYKNKLVGLFSVHELFKADRRARIETIINNKVISAHPHDPIKDSLKKMYRYDLSALPVVSRHEEKLLGIVTFRDAVSVYLPKRWKTRIRRIFTGGYS